MKTIINALIVVEGKTDIDFLSSFIEASFYSVNGSSVSQENYDFINEYLKKGEVIVLTDPDFPGKQIRTKIKEHCNGVSEAFIKKETSIKNNKVGVAEGNKEEILESLKNRLKYRDFDVSRNDNKISLQDLYNLNLVGENSKELRSKICDKYHLGHNNTKQFLKKLNLLNISLEEIKEVIKNAK